MAERTMRGALAPVVTPFRADGAVDAERLVAHCRRLLAVDCGLAVFGTNSEGTSLSAGEKIDLLDRLVGEGLDPGRMMPGTGSPALADAIAVSRHAVRIGCGGCLMLPPYYYKAVSDEGLYRFVAEVIAGVGDDRLRIYLYHIPPIAVLGWSLPLVERLLKDFPGVVVGMKDSTGDEAHSRAVAEAFPGFGLFVGSEMYLRAAMGFGAVGTISAICNVNAAMIARLAAEWETAEGERLQARCREIRSTFSRYDVIAAMKTAIADGLDDPAWRRVRPPLLPLPDDKASALRADLAAIDFDVRSWMVEPA